MGQVKSKVYYELNSGNVILITSEIEGTVKELTKEEDFNFYPELKGKDINSFDFVELEFGTMADTFQNIKSYSVNTTTKKLECIYFTSEELAEMQKQEEQQLEKITALQDRTANISDYLTENPSSIDDIENYILQNELNKVTEGMS